MAQPRRPGTKRVQGGGPGRLSGYRQAAWGSHRGGTRPSCGGLEGRQGGSLWFGQIMPSEWNHSPVTISIA